MGGFNTGLSLYDFFSLISLPSALAIGLVAGFVGLFLTLMWSFHFF